VLFVEPSLLATSFLNLYTPPPPVPPRTADAAFGVGLAPILGREALVRVIVPVDTMFDAGS